MKYTIVDNNHIAHRMIVNKPLHSVVNRNGKIEEIETTIPYYTLKAIGRYARDIDGYPVKTAICFEGKGNFRKQYFTEASGNVGTYKEQRKPFYPLIKGIELTNEMLRQTNTSVYSADGYESDDCIYTLIQAIKKQDPEPQIRVMTNDADLLPLVDDVTSVYMRGTRQYATPGHSEFRLYYEVTPETWYEYLQTTSAFKKYDLPYNSVILFKLIRGDASDNISGAVKGYGPKKFNTLIEQMREDKVEFEKIFRYENEFEVMEEVLKTYFTEEEVAKMKYIYNGMRLQLIVPKDKVDQVKLPNELDTLGIGNIARQYGINTLNTL